jgi:hypothetical protein
MPAASSAAAMIRLVISIWSAAGVGRPDRHRLLPRQGECLRPGDRGLLRRLRRPERTRLRHVHRSHQLRTAGRANRLVNEPRAHRHGGFSRLLQQQFIECLCWSLPCEGLAGAPIELGSDTAPTQSAKVRPGCGELSASRGVQPICFFREPRRAGGCGLTVLDDPHPTATGTVAATFCVKSASARGPDGARKPMASSDGRRNTVIVEVLYWYRSGSGFVMSGWSDSGSW